MFKFKLQTLRDILSKHHTIKEQYEKNKIQKPNSLIFTGSQYLEKHINSIEKLKDDLLNSELKQSDYFRC